MAVFKVIFFFSACPLLYLLAIRFARKFFCLDCKMDIVDLISQVGFPIVMNLILIVQINGKLDEILREIKK